MTWSQMYLDRERVLNEMLNDLLIGQLDIRYLAVCWFGGIHSFPAGVFSFKASKCLNCNGVIVKDTTC